MVDSKKIFRVIFYFHNEVVSSCQIGYTFLPCVLAGLSRAPQYVVGRSHGAAEDARCVLGSDVDSVVLPVDACGGEAALALARRSSNKVTYDRFQTPSFSV